MFFFYVETLKFFKSNDPLSIVTTTVSFTEGSKLRDGNKRNFL